MRMTSFVKTIANVSIVQIACLFVSYLQPRLYLKWLGTDTYGDWLTILSITSWAVILDLGLSTSCRPFLSNSLITRKYNQAKSILGSILTIQVILSMAILLPVLLIILFIDASSIRSNLLKVVIIATFVLLRQPLNIIYPVLEANRKHSSTIIIQAMPVALMLLPAFFLLPLPTPHIFSVAFLFFGISICILLLSYAVIFSRIYPEIAPTLFHFNFSEILPLLRLSKHTLAIQVSAIVLFSTDSLIINTLISPSAVVSYTIAHRLFFILIIIFNTISSPLLSSLSDAFSRNDNHDVVSLLSHAAKIGLGFICAGLFIFMFHRPILWLWLGNQAPAISIYLLALMFLYSTIHLFNAIITTVLIARRCLLVQSVTAVFSALLNVPLSYFSVKYLGMGPSGVIAATIVCMLPAGILGLLQLKQLKLV